MPRVRSLSNREKRLVNIMKMKKADIIAAHKMKHPQDNELYKKTKKDIALALMQAQWWPVSDFPVTISSEEKKIANK